MKRWLVAVAAVWAMTAGAGEAVKLRLITDWYPQPEHGGFYHALLAGYYKQAGLDVEIVPGGPNVFAYQRVAAGRGEFGMGNCDDILAANDRGIPVVAVGATMQHDPIGILLHDDDPVRDWPDLDGRSVSVTPGAPWFPFIVAKYHLGKTREVPATYSVGPFIKDSRYIQQCFITSEPFFLKQAGVKSRVMLISSSGYDPYRLFFTRRDILEKHPDWVGAFTLASLKGWRDYLESPDKVHARLRELNPELNPERMMFSHDALVSGRFIYGDPAKGDLQGHFTAARWEFQFGVLKAQGVIKGGFALTNAWTGAFCNTYNP
jgi:NitT/TauT family transport system substrate-binding protein